MTRANSPAGYTLIELLIVLAIIGLLATTALPMLSAARPGLTSKAAARDVAHALATARQEAIDRDVEERVVFDAALGRYAVRPAGSVHVLPRGAVLGASHEIDFYGDGSTNGGVVLVRSGLAKHHVTVRWPGGQIAVDD